MRNGLTIIGSLVLVCVLMMTGSFLSASLGSGRLLSPPQADKVKARPRLADVETDLGFRLRTGAAEMKVISGLPIGKDGSGIKGKPEFTIITTNAESGFITLEIGDEPVWIVEGSLPEKGGMSPEKSPFGFHPAFTGTEDYGYAREIGVVWDRGGRYMFWHHGQPDPVKKQYEWKIYDEYFKRLPEGMRTLKNITVVFDGLVDLPGRRRLGGRRSRRSADISRHLEGTTYRPKDPGGYSLWVKAAVERYDGDGKDDMPGLRIPAKHWQVDNEPPRGREGYADLVRITSRAIKEADPNAKVLIGGLTMPCDVGVWRYEKDALPIIRELNGKDIDILDLHWFGRTGEWKLLPEALARVRKDMRDCSFKDVPIWITEMGTYSGKPAARRRRQFLRQSERGQASEMVKRHVVALGEGVGKIFWAWGMIEGFVNVQDNDFFDNTGFVYDGIGPDDPGKGIKKISYWAYQRMTHLLGHWDGSQPESIEAGEGVVAYRFRFHKSSKTGIVAAWAQ